MSTHVPRRTRVGHKDVEVPEVGDLGQHVYVNSDRVLGHFVDHDLGSIGGQGWFWTNQDDSVVALELTEGTWLWTGSPFVDIRGNDHPTMIFRDLYADDEDPGSSPAFDHYIGGVYIAVTTRYGVVPATKPIVVPPGEKRYVFEQFAAAEATPAAAGGKVRFWYGQGPDDPVLQAVKLA